MIKLLSASLALAILVILLGGFYMIIDNRLDRLEQADANIVQGINQALNQIGGQSAQQAPE